MKLLRKTTLTILSFLFLLSLVFAFNFNAESVYADAALIEMNGTTYTSIQDAINAAPYDAETEIKLSGDFSVASSITIEGDATLGQKKLVFNIVGDTKITRANADPFIMFNIKALSNITFKTTNNAKLVIDGNRMEVIDFNANACMFKVDTSSLSLNGNITLQNNTANEGAAIYLSASSNVNIDGISFIRNTADGRAAAIYNHGQLIVNKCSFVNNFGGSAGGVILSTGKTNITNCSFDNNGLKGYTNYTHKWISDSTEIGDINGGVLEVRSGTTTIDNCEFKNSHSESIKDSRVRSYGGAIDISGGTLNIVSAKFNNNTADYGGAIFVQSGRLNVTDMTMTGNTALYEAGGIYVNGGVVQIANGKIGNNVGASGRAQDVYFVTSQASSCLFGAEITSENTYAIYSNQDFVVGENFAVASGSRINLEKEKKIIVKEKLKTAGPILIGVIGTTDAELVGKPLVVFANQAVVKENVFTLSNPDYSLVLPTDYESLTEPYLFVSIEYTIEFYKYYDAETDTYSELIGTPRKVPYGGTAVAPTEAEVGEREGYVFGGWRTKDSEDIVLTNIKKSMKIYAIWGQKIKITYKVFDDNENVWKELSGLTDEQTTIVSGSKISSLPSIPTKTGYTAHTPYWAYDQNGDTAYNNEPVNEAITLYAIYIPDILKITFIREDGSTQEVEVEYNTAFTGTIPTILSKTGYDQVAPYWAYDESGENAFDASRIIKSNFNLYEIYKINRYTVEFYVNFYHNLSAETGKELLECKKVHEMTVDYNTIVQIFPSLPANEAFTQNQVVWNYQNAPIVENTAIYGDIDINVYLVKFEADGEITNSYNIEHGKTLESVPEIPEKVGYNQVAPSWFLNGATTEDAVTSNRTFVAKYTQNIYTVTFVLPDDSRVERIVKHGESVNADNVITKGFGELIRFDRSLDNITEDCEIHVWKVNLFMWIMIAFGGILLLVLLIIVIKIIKKKKLQSIARKKHKHTRNRVGPFVTGDDE